MDNYTPTACLTLTSPSKERWVLNTTSTDPPLVAQWAMANRLPARCVLCLMLDIMKEHPEPPAHGKSFKKKCEGWTLSFKVL